MTDGNPFDKLYVRGAGAWKKTEKAEEAVKNWLEEKFSIPAGVEDVDGFMEQFVKSFGEIQGITELKKMPDR